MTQSNTKVNSNSQLSPDGFEYQKIRASAAHCVAKLRSSAERITDQKEFCDRLYESLLADRTSIDTWGALSAATQRLDELTRNAPWN